MKLVVLLSAVLYQIISVIEAQTDAIIKCINYPKENMTKLLYVESVLADVKLNCDATNLENAAGEFTWQYCDSACSRYSMVYEKDSYRKKYEMDGTGFNGSLLVGKASTEETGFYCCNPMIIIKEDEKWSFPAIRKYALLVLPENFQPTLVANPEGVVEENTEVTLKCEIPTHSKLRDIIVPAIEWKLPKTLQKPSSPNAIEYTYKADENLGGKQFQCVVKYELPTGTREFPSNIVFGNNGESIIQNTTSISAEKTIDTPSTVEIQGTAVQSPSRRLILAFLCLILFLNL